MITFYSTSEKAVSSTHNELIISKKILTTAKKEADSILETAKKRSEKFYQDKLTQLEIEKEQAKAELVVFQTELKRQNYFAIRDNLLELVELVLKKLISKELKQNRESIRTRVDRALSNFTGRVIIKLSINPTDASFVEKLLLDAHHAEFSLVQSDEIKHGSFRLQASDSIYDFNVNSQFEAVMRALKRKELKNELLLES